MVRPSRFYRFGEFELDSLEETLRHEGEKLDINRRMFQVLLLLVERNGAIVTKEEFFENVWGGSFVEDNNLTVTITGLRKALGDNAKQARFIENLPRKGYRFIAPVECVIDAGTAPTTLATETTATHETISRLAPSRSIRPLTLAIGILSILFVLTLAIVVGGRKIIWPASVPAADRIDSIAVLPFEHRTADSEYLADGLTDGIISNLSRQTGLRVIDRNSANFYKNKTIDLAAAGSELNVRAVMTGQIEQTGDVLIINAELTDLDSNTQLWRQQFRRQTTDLYATQLEISRAVVQSLRPVEADRTQASNEKRRPRDPIAYDLYLKGRYYWNKRTDSDFEKSAQFFKSAIDQDPTFAQAYIGLADAYTLCDPSRFNLSPEEKNAFIRGNIQKALEIDNSLGEAYAALAINECYYDWDFSGAERDYRRALELDPGHATAHHWYAEFLAMQGRFGESFAEYDRALSLDPLSLPIKTDRALNYYNSRDFDSAIDRLNKVKEQNPEYARTYEFLAHAYNEKGMLDESVDSSEQNLTIKFQHGDFPFQTYEQVKKYLAELKNGVKNGGSDGFWLATLETKADPSAYNKAIACSKLRNPDKAFEFLERSFTQRESGLVWLKVMPEFDGIRSDPRYKDLLLRVGFSD